jgi:integrase
MGRIREADQLTWRADIPHNPRARSPVYSGGINMEKKRERRGGLTKEYGKGGKARSVPLDPQGEARRVLDRLRKDSRSGWIFTSPHSGQKLTRVDKSIAKACELAEIQPAITLHVLRHTFCTRLAASGHAPGREQQACGRPAPDELPRIYHWRSGEPRGETGVTQWNSRD